jgi:hypothetical protein
MYRFFDRSRENLSRGGTRDYGRDSLGLRDGSEMVVSDSCVKGKEQNASLICYLSVNLVRFYVCKLLVVPFFCFPTTLHELFFAFSPLYKSERKNPKKTFFFCPISTAKSEP